MVHNINQKKTIYKWRIGSKLFLSTIGSGLLGFKSCGQGVSDGLQESNKNTSSIAFKSSKHQGKAQDNISYLADDGNHFLGNVSYLKQDHHFGLIQLDHPSKVHASKKMGLIFYAPIDCTNCSAIHFCNQGVILSCLDGSTKVLSTFMEVDGTLFDRLSKNAEPLLHKNDHNRLKATHISDFTICTDLDYGIQYLKDTENMPNENGIILRKGSMDKEKVDNINNAGFMFTKCTSVSTSNLFDLVRHLSTNSVANSSMTDHAPVLEHTLKADTTSVSDATYCYIKHHNRYRLIQLNQVVSNNRGSQYGGSRAIGQLGCSNERQTTQNVISPTDGLSKHVETANIAVQTASSLLGKYCHDGQKNKVLEWVWDGSYDFPGQHLNECSIESSTFTLDKDWDSSSVESGMQDQDEHESDYSESHSICRDEQTEDDGQKNKVLEWVWDGSYDFPGQSWNGYSGGSSTLYSDKKPDASGVESGIGDQDGSESGHFESHRICSDDQKEDGDDDQKEDSDDSNDSLANKLKFTNDFYKLCDIVKVCYTKYVG